MSWDILKSQPFWALAGVIVGSMLTTAKDVFLDRRNQKRLATYAAIRIVCVFDDFIEGCLAVATDEGEYQIESHGEEEREISVGAPQLQPFAQDIDWKALDPEISYQVLSFQRGINEAQRSIAFVFDMISGPPDYNEGFEERQFYYAQLGIQALSITNALRRKHGLSPRTYAEEWDPAKRLPEIRSSVEQARTTRAKRRAVLFTETDDVERA